MSFTRKFLKDNGVPEDKIDVILAERNRTLADYVSKDDVQKQIDDALAGIKPAPVTESDEYKKLLGEFDDYKKRTEARSSDDFKGVKSKFFDQVYQGLDHSKPYPDQLVKIRADFPEYFDEDKPAEPAPAGPTFGGEPKGGMPSGDDKSSFNAVWGYGKK